jgi:hypothetical protein
VDLPAEVEHPHEALQGDLTLVVVIAEPDAELVGDGPLLDAADEDVYALFLEMAASSS